MSQDDYRFQALEHYRALRENLQRVSQLQAHYGTWLIATIAATHLAAIYFVGSLDSLLLATKIKAIWTFVIGLILIILCGFVAWINWGLHTLNYERWANSRMLVDPSAWPKAQPQTEVWIKITYWLSIILGILSVCTILIGAAVVTCVA